MSTPVLQRPQPTPAARRGDVRAVRIRADLLPDEIVQGRAGLAMRGRVLRGLLAVVVALGAWYGLSWWQTHSARDDLAGLQTESTELQQRTHQYAPLVSTRADTAAIKDRLGHLMTGDMSWKAMLGSLRAAAPSGVSLSQVSGTLTTAVGAATAPGAGTSADGLTPGSLDTSGRTPVGTLTISGTATSKTLVARYTDALGRIKGVVAPYITSVTASGRTFTFSLSAVVTSDVLGGRYAPTTTPSAAGAAGATAPQNDGGK